MGDIRCRVCGEPVYPPGIDIRGWYEELVISDIRDMKERPVSPALVKAVASRVQRMLRELGLTAIVSVRRNPDISQGRPRKVCHPRGATQAGACPLCGGQTFEWVCRECPLCGLYDDDPKW